MRCMYMFVAMRQQANNKSNQKTYKSQLAATLLEYFCVSV